MRLNMPGKQPENQCLIFSEYVFARGSFGATLLKSGAFAFLEGKMKDFSLYELRDRPLPSKANLSGEVLRELTECFKDILLLCEELAPNSIEQLSIQIMATQLLHYLSANGVRAKDMLGAMRKFRDGKWETLWKDSTKTSDKIKAVEGRPWIPRRSSLDPPGLGVFSGSPGTKRSSLDPRLFVVQSRPSLDPVSEKASSLDPRTKNGPLWLPNFKYTRRWLHELRFKQRGRGENVGRGKRVSESLRVQDQTEPQVEPALMWSPRTTSERKNGLCIRRNFGAAQEQACETCRMLRGRGHHGSQHANATEFFRSESRNLLNWMLAATGSVKVALESACIMLLGFRVRLLGLRVAWCAIGDTTDR